MVFKMVAQVPNYMYMFLHKTNLNDHFAIVKYTIMNLILLSNNDR